MMNLMTNNYFLYTTLCNLGTTCIKDHSHIIPYLKKNLFKKKMIIVVNHYVEHSFAQHNLTFSKSV